MTLQQVNYRTQCFNFTGFLVVRFFFSAFRKYQCHEDDVQIMIINTITTTIIVIIIIVFIIIYNNYIYWIPNSVLSFKPHHNPIKHLNA